MTERTCATCVNCNGRVCKIDGFIMGSSDAACEFYRAGQTGDRDEGTGIKCPNCGRQIDFHSGHINRSNVFVCEKGKPLMREIMYYCRACDSTVIFLKKCEPEEVDHDR